MKKFRITIERPIVERAEVYISAWSEFEAIKIALAESEDAEEVDWYLTDKISNPEVIDIEEIKE